MNERNKDGNQASRDMGYQDEPMGAIPKSGIGKGSKRNGFPYGGMTPPPETHSNPEKHNPNY